MTKKDYILIAKVFNASRVTPDTEEERQRNIAVYYLAHRLADTLAQDNDKFEKYRFLKACNCLSHEERSFDFIQS